MARKKEKNPESLQLTLLKAMIGKMPENIRGRMLDLIDRLDKMSPEARQWSTEFVEAFMDIQTAMLAEIDNQECDGEGVAEDDEKDILIPTKLSSYVQKYTLRIELRDCPVPVWRRIEVPSNLTLAALDYVLIYIMGWMDEHLSQFSKNGKYYMTAEKMGEDSYALKAEDYTIADLLQKKNQSCTWEYDFGDSWTHDVKLSGVAEYKADEPRILVFKAGEGACPPEDCGGVWGYGELLNLHQKRLSGKKLTRDEKDRLDWYCIDKDHDPNLLDEEDNQDFIDYFNSEFFGQE